MKRSTAENGESPAEGADEGTASKQAKLEDPPQVEEVAVAASNATAGDTGNSDRSKWRGPLKKAVLMFMYSGTGYNGMQRNIGFQTIEGTLFDCLFAGGHITREEFASAGRLQFQRASKTDKGVSALAQVVSLRLDLSDTPALKSDLASRLPPEIRLLDICRTTKNFNCKARVNYREYAYICPSYTFAPKRAAIDVGYRIDAGQLRLLRDCLARYKGTKNYYNFTSGRQPGDASCNRYIIDVTAGEPFVHQDAEFVELLVRGQSFMLHQIRKMVGLAVAVVKGYCELAVIDRAFTFRRMDVPKAPGLGLLLSRIDYGAYNGKYANELGYPTIDWDRFGEERSQFKSDVIMPEIYRGEIAERSMLEWLKTLNMHSYDFERVPGPLTAAAEQPSAAAEQPSAAAEQPSAAADQPSAAAEQPSAAVEQSSAAAEQPSAAAEQPSAAVEQPSAAVEQPSTAPASVDKR